MTKTIWKFQLKTEDIQTIKMPKGSEVLTVQTQYDQPVLWAIVNPNEEQKENRVIEIFGSGNPLPESVSETRKYISTFQSLKGAFVGHVFEYLN